jgi:hypothetical protein
VELLRRYENSRIGFVDPAVVAVAERLKIQRIFTTDRRDFAIGTTATFVKHSNYYRDEATTRGNPNYYCLLSNGLLYQTT